MPIPAGLEELQSSICHTFFSIKETVYGPISSVSVNEGSLLHETNTHNDKNARDNKCFDIIIGY